MADVERLSLVVDEEDLLELAIEERHLLPCLSILRPIFEAALVLKEGEEEEASFEFSSSTISSKTDFMSNFYLKIRIFGLDDSKAKRPPYVINNKLIFDMCVICRHFPLL